jgi:hypothetical protein
MQTAASIAIITDSSIVPITIKSTAAPSKQTITTIHSTLINIVSITSTPSSQSKCKQPWPFFGPNNHHKKHQTKKNSLYNIYNTIYNQQNYQKNLLNQKLTKNTLTSSTHF